MRIAEALERAEKLFARKEKRAQRAADFSIAGKEYQQEQQRQLDNLGRLRQRRLEREHAAELGRSKATRAKKSVPREDRRD